MKPISFYQHLLVPKFRHQEHAFLVEGRLAVEQLVHTGQSSLIEICSTAELAPLFTGCTVPLSIWDKQRIDKVCPSKTPQGVFAVAAIPADSYSSELPVITGNRILILENVQDPGNVGTLIRTASAFGYSGVVMSEQTADPFSPKVVQASAGSLFSIWIRRSTAYLAMIKKLKAAGFLVLGASLDGDTSLMRCHWGRHALLLGNEGSGITDDARALAESMVRIPIRDKAVESLNVAISGAILMYLGSEQAF